MPIGIGLAIGGLTSLGGAFLSSNAATTAAGMQEQAASRAAGINWAEFNRIQKQLEPFMKSGRVGNADLLHLLTSGGADRSFLTESPQRLAGLGKPLEDVKGSGLMRQFQTSPSYNFEMKQGTQAIQDAGAGVTGALSGNTLKALQSYGTGLAGQDFWNWYNAQNQQYWNRYNAAANRQSSVYNMLSGLSGQGLGAASMTGQFGSNAANLYGQDIMSGANAGAAGTIGSANAITGGLNSLGTNAMNASLLYSIFNNGTSGATSPGPGTGGLY